MDGSLCGFRSRVSHLSSSSSGFNHMCSISGVALQRKAFGGDIGSKQAPVQQVNNHCPFGAYGPAGPGLNSELSCEGPDLFSLGGGERGRSKPKQQRLLLLLLQEQSFSSLGANTDTTLLETQDVLLDPLEGREARENQDQD
ncbi:hypothetical protein VZT92_012333 [Zoarces viviparus]|uniref:Uncharacterized protein n=1 Tax=Zoarces viviparus TaxID=48416 RepID=A0AAW1F8G7_ZOAVI